MVLLLGLVKAPLLLSWMSFAFFFVILLGLGVLCLLALFPFVIALIVLLVGPPPWRLLAFGGVRDLVTANLADRREVVPADASREVFGVRNAGLRRKRIRLNRKPPAQPLQGLVFNLGHVCGKD